MKIAQLISDNREPFRDYDNPVPWFGTAPEALLQGFSQMPEVEIHIVSCCQQRIKSPAKLADNIYFHGLYVSKIGWLRTGYQGCIRAARAKLREIRPDIVHGQGSERDQNISAVFSGFPNVVTIHGNMAPLARFLKARPGSYMWCAGLIEDFVLPRTRGVFCNSAYTEAMVHPRNPRTWRVPNALRAQFFQPLPKRTRGNPPRLINIGVVCPRKQQVELLEVFKRLHERGEPCRIDFIGTVDPSTSYCRRFLNAMKDAEARGYARYIGLKDVDALVATLDESDACVHFPTEEAFGLAVPEALARNLKLFASHVGGIIDIAASIDGAELYEPNDWTGLENAVLRWLRKGCPAPENAAPAMAKLYHPNLIAQRHVEIYREVLGRK